MKHVKWLFVLVIMCLNGCAYHIHYNPDHYKAELASVDKTLPGKVLIYTEVKDDEKVYSQHPSSFTGSSSTLNVKVGEILKNISVEFFARKFIEGAYHTNKPEGTEGYILIIKPEILNFEYRYNQLKNLGFAITPEAKIDLFVYLYDPDKNLILEKKYESDYTSGGSYVVSVSADKRVNKAIHQSIYRLLNDVAIDVEQIIVKLRSAKS